MTWFGWVAGRPRPACSGPITRPPSRRQVSLGRALAAAGEARRGARRLARGRRGAASGPTALATRTLAAWDEYAAAFLAAGHAARRCAATSGRWPAASGCTGRIIPAPWPPAAAGRRLPGRGQDQGRHRPVQAGPGRPGSRPSAPITRTPWRRAPAWPPPTTPPGRWAPRCSSTSRPAPGTSAPSAPITPAPWPAARTWPAPTTPPGQLGEAVLPAARQPSPAASRPCPRATRSPGAAAGTGRHHRGDGRRMTAPAPEGKSRDGVRLHRRRRRARPAACWPPGSARTPASGCCCWRRAAPSGAAR